MQVGDGSPLWYTHFAGEATLSWTITQTIETIIQGEHGHSELFRLFFFTGRNTHISQLRVIWIISFTGRNIRICRWFNPILVVVFPFLLSGHFFFGLTWYTCWSFMMPYNTSSRTSYQDFLLFSWLGMPLNWCTHDLSWCRVIIPGLHIRAFFVFVTWYACSFFTVP